MKKLLRLIIFLVLFGGIGYGVWVGVFASGCGDTDKDGLNNRSEEHTSELQSH